MAHFGLRIEKHLNNIFDEAQPPYAISNWAGAAAFS